LPHLIIICIYIKEKAVSMLRKNEGQIVYASVEIDNLEDRFKKDIWEYEGSVKLEIG